MWSGCAPITTLNPIIYSHCICAANVQSDPALGPTPIPVGYRQPSPAKELLRLFGAKLPPQLPLALRRAVLEARRVLHALLLRCMRKVCQASGMQLSHRALRRATQRGLNCPTDLFYYNNEGSSEAVPNCSAHVDRGYLHAIVVSPTDGLEVFDRQSECWHSLRSRWPEARPLADVVVLANDSLARLSREHPSWMGAPVDACIHRVAKAASPRLSISHELREPVDCVDELSSRGS